MIARIIRFAMRFRRVREEAAKQLVEEIKAERERERVREGGRYCHECGKFGRKRLSVNAFGWCKGFKER